jgi:hypothetical protein
MQDKDDLLDEEFGDLLAGISTAKETPPVATPSPTPPVVPTAPSPSPVPTGVTNLSTPTGKRDPFATVPFGTKVPTVPIPRFKATKTAKTRVAFISKGVLPIKTHYVDGMGSFVCFEGKCCELEGLPKVRYLLPIIVYETDRTGKIISENISVQALSLGEDAYSALGDAVLFSGKGIQDIDVIISCTDETYQKLTFTVDNSVSPQWKTFKTARSMVDYFKENRDRLYMAVARTMEESTYLSRKGFVMPATSQAPRVDNPEDLLD